MFYAHFCILLASSNVQLLLVAKGSVITSVLFYILGLRSEEMKTNYLTEKTCNHFFVSKPNKKHIYLLLAHFHMIIVYGMQHKSMVTATTDKLRRKWKLRKG